MGEWEGARQWYRGDPPARRPLPILVGDPTCIRDGEDPALVAILGVSAECGKVLPDACYGLEQTIFEKTNVFDCVFGKASCDIINEAYTDLDEAAAMVLTYMPVGTIVSTFPPSNDLVPAGVIATISDTVVLWLTGTTNFQQLALQAFYFGTGPANQGPYSTSPINERAMLAIADLLNARGLGAAERIVLCGHSFGGAVCEVLAARMLSANPNRNVEILTLGAPAPGDARLHDLIALLAQRHYCNERDPIPYMPPRGLTFAGLIPFLGPLLSSFWPRFVRPPQSKQISTDGKFVDVRTEDLPDDLITIASLAIAGGFDVPSFKDHRTDWYGYYLCLACKCVTRPCVQPDPVMLGFDFILEGLRWTDGTFPYTENFASNLTYDPLADVWYANDGIDPKVLITATRDTLGNYDVFDVKYFVSDAGVIHESFEWHFPREEMVLGIDTTSLPVLTSFNPFAAVVAMGRLVIPSSFGFPPVDGGGDGGFEPIMDGDGLP